MKTVTVLSAPLVLTLTLLLAPTGDAEAHRADVRWQSGHANHYSAPPRHRLILPRWLHHNHDFRRWYRYNYHRGHHGHGWKHVYKRYQRDHHWHGYGKRKHRQHDDRYKHRGKRRYRGRH